MGLSYYDGFEWLPKYLNSFLRILIVHQSFPSFQNTLPQIIILAFRKRNNILSVLNPHPTPCQPIISQSNQTVSSRLITRRLPPHSSAELPITDEFCFLVCNGRSIIGDQLFRGGAIRPGSADVGVVVFLSSGTWESLDDDIRICLQREGGQMNLVIPDTSFPTSVACS